MRVITGKARGARLTTLDGVETRPTSEKVKEGIFSAINFNLPGSRVLDLYAGSGQLGIEALSRGAVRCTFVDSSRAACDIVKENLKRAKLDTDALVLAEKCEDFVSRRRENYDIIICDPPYRINALDSLIPKMAALLADGGIIVAEAEKKYQPKPTDGIELYRSYSYGNTAVHIFTKPAKE